MPNGSVIIKSLNDGNNISVNAAGTLDVADDKEGERCQFDVEIASTELNVLYFVSRLTKKVLACTTGSGVPKTMKNDERDEKEKMLIWECFPDPRGVHIVPRSIDLQ